MNLKRLFTFLMSLVCVAVFTFAQSSGDKLYNQGLQLQKTMTVAAQKSAISKFNSAKKLYDSAAKKAQCDQAIAVSNNIISSLGQGPKPNPNSKTKSGTVTQTVEVVKKVDPFLTVTNSEFNVDLDSKKLEVGVNTNLPEWSVQTVANADGSSFVSVSKNGSSGFTITVPENLSTSVREQKISVQAGDIVREVTVRQTGFGITLESTVRNMEFKFKEKQQTKDMDVSCNSDHSYPENNGLNWYVESAPSWIRIVPNEKKKNIFQRGLNAAKNLVEGSSSNSGQGISKSNMVIICEGQKPGTLEAHDGRKGEIVLRSGDKTLVIYVAQSGNWKTVDADHARQIKNLKN